MSDGNAPDPTRTSRRNKKTQATKAAGEGPAEAAKRTARETQSATRQAPAAEAQGPREPVWTPEAMATPKLATLPKPATEVAPRRIPNWEGPSPSATGSDARWRHDGETSPPVRHVRSGTATDRPHRRSRTFKTAALLASLFVVFVAVTAIMVLLHHSANAPGGKASTVSVAAADASRMQVATRAIDAETSTTRTKLHALPGIPTPVRVAAVINPYVASLHQYGSVLSRHGMPTSARTAVASTHALVTGDAQFLSTIKGLPPLLLGTYLERFSRDSAQLQKALGTLEQKLRASTT